MARFHVRSEPTSSEGRHSVPQTVLQGPLQRGHDWKWDQSGVVVQCLRLGKADMIMLVGSYNSRRAVV